MDGYDANIRPTMQALRANTVNLKTVFPALEGTYTERDLPTQHGFPPAREVGSANGRNDGF